jgi:replicative DNA helicase
MVSMPKLITPEDLWKRGVDRYSDLRDGKHKGIKLGYKELDDALGGLFGGELCYLAARPKTGKSELMLSMGRYTGLHFGNVLMASLEQPWGDILDRWMAGSTGISPRLIRAGNYSEDRFDSIMGSMQEVGKSGLFFYDSGGDISGSTTSSIHSIANHMKMSFGLAAIFIDQLSMIRSDIVTKSLYEKTTEISHKLKQLSMDIDVPVICACQINRDTENRENHRPQVSDLRDSGYLEADADTILLLYRPENYESELEAAEKEGKNIRGKAELTIGAQRQGGEVMGVTIDLKWDRFRRCYVDEYMSKETPEQFR